MNRFIYIPLILCLSMCFFLSSCSEPVYVNDTPPDMTPKDNVFTISNDTDLVYRGESVQTDDLVYRGEAYDAVNL